jgi:hypothetical protein
MASNEKEPRVIRKDDLVAETLEEEADRMPPGPSEETRVRRESAKRLRASDDQRTVKEQET